MKIVEKSTIDVPRRRLTARCNGWLMKSWRRVAGTKNLGADRYPPARSAVGAANRPSHARDRPAWEVPVGTLDITLYRDDLSKVAPQAVLQSSDIAFGVDGMNLVLVDDVLYTGRTIRAAMNGLFDLGRPQRVSLCVLIDRGHREMPIESQYTGRVGRPATRRSSRCGYAKLIMKSA